MKAALTTLLAATLLLACQSSPKLPAAYADDGQIDSIAVTYYRMLADGDFAGYVQAMQSCDNAPEQYKKRTETLLRHHQKEIERTKQGVRAVTSLRHELHDNGQMANVFLRVAYNDSTEEEIIFPIVYDGQRWRIR